MFSLTKKTDYALLALCGLAREPQGRALNTKVIADRYHIPPELLAKILQQLARKRLVVSTSGPTGGYRLARRPIEITVKDVVDAVDGQAALVQCFREGHDGCVQFATCTIRSPLELVQKRMAEVLNETTMHDLVLSTMETQQIVPVGEFQTQAIAVGEQVSGPE